GLMVVLDGALDVWVERPQSEASRMAEGPEKKSDRREKLFVVQPGGVAGYLAALTGSASFVTVRAAMDTCVAFLPKEALDRVVERHPRLILLLARKLVGQLTPLILHVDFALEWLQVGAGKELYRQGAPSDAVHIVLNGRLRTVMEESGKKPRVLAEHGQGDSLGEVEMLTGMPRPARVYAIRDTELARMPKSLFDAL
ncbi:cyclic nucleotide-binding-like protein, partial [Piptocephalis cylindrospora]